MSDTPLARLAKAAEDATDEFTAAVDAASEAEAAFMRRYHATKGACPEDWSEAKKTNHAETVAYEEKIAQKQTEWGVERAKAVLRTRLAILSAAQSHIRAVEKQGG